jgi:hypothetical protein
MITSKELAETILMFYNLLYHLDDYIKNKKERKQQLKTSKNIRLVLREVISSIKNVMTLNLIVSLTSKVQILCQIRTLKTKK